MTTDSQTRRFPTAQALVCVTAVAALLVPVAAAVASLAEGGASRLWETASFAGAVVWTTAVLSVAMVALLAPLGLTAAIYAYFAGMMLRLALCLTAAWIAIGGGWLQAVPVAIALAVFYMPLLALESAFIGRFMWSHDTPAEHQSLQVAHDVTRSEVTA